MVRMSDSGMKRLEPPTEEERRRALEALDRIEARHKQLLAERGGRWFPSAAEVIRELRDEQELDSR